MLEMYSSFETQIILDFFLRSISFRKRLYQRRKITTLKICPRFRIVFFLQIHANEIQMVFIH